MFKKLFLIFFSTSIVWSGVLPSIKIGAVSLFPLRFMIIIAFILIFLNIRKITFSKIEVFTIIFFGTTIFKSLLSFMWSSNLAHNISIFSFYLVSFSVVMISSLIIVNQFDLQIALTSYAFNVFLSSLMGIYESLTGNYIFGNTTHLFYTWRTNSLGFHFPLVHTFNPNNFASFLALSIPLILMVKTNNRFVLRLFKFFLILLIITNIIMSESRGNLLALVVIFILNFYWKINKNSLVHKRIKTLIGISIFMSIPILVWYSWNNPFDARIIIWGNTLTTLGKTFFTGVGIGNTEYVNTNMGYGNTTIYSAHNFLLEFFSDFGLIPFILIIAWLLLLYSLLKQTFAPNNSNLKLFMITFIIVMMIPSSMVGMYYVWFGFGIVVSQISRFGKLSYSADII